MNSIKLTPEQAEAIRKHREEARIEREAARRDRERQHRSNARTSYLALGLLAFWVGVLMGSTVLDFAG